MELLKFVLCTLCLNFVWCKSENYRAAVVDVTEADVDSNKFASFINEAAKLNVDLLVLPSPKSVTELGLEDFDEVVKTISAAAKDVQIYVVASLYERTQCQNKEELMSSNLVFDRNGAVVSVFRKPVNRFTKCNRTSLKIGSFTADFGVTFGVVSEKDLVLANVREADGIKNFIVTDSSSSKKSFLFAKQFTSSWAFVNGANIISTGGYFGGQDKSRRINRLVVSELGKSGSGQSLLIAGPSSSFSSEELSQYLVKPLNMEASMQGYSESVCHGSFCCQFYVKTDVIGTNPQDISYGLVAFNGMHQMDSNNIGVQTCSLVACAGLYKRSCYIGSENATNIKFNVISINANFSTENSAQFPTISSTTRTVFNKENLTFIIDNKYSKHVTTELRSSENLLSFGIFGRDYSKDFEIVNENSTESIVPDFSDYISSENVQEFFDYVWIRLRVLIFIVSIYVLEMM